MKKLSKKQILMLHTQLIQQTGGSDGVRDYNGNKRIGTHAMLVFLALKHESQRIPMNEFVSYL